MASTGAAEVRRRRTVLSAVLVPCLVVASACGLPRDARGTSERLREGGPLRVGAAAAAPFTMLAPGEEPRGPEPDLARRLARAWGTRVQWREGPPHELVRALEHGALDLVVGGIPPGTYDGPGSSRPWIRTRRTLGVAGDVAPGDASALRSLRVVARTASIDAELARDAGADVEERDDPFAAGLPVVAPAFELRAHGLTPAPFALDETPRIVLVRAGENAFLMEVDRLLHRERAWAHRRLEEAARNLPAHGVP